MRGPQRGAGRLWLFATFAEAEKVIPHNYGAAGYA